MKLLRTTREHSNYWIFRKIDWEKDYNSTWNHPYRYVISKVLSTLNWLSLVEIGSGSGAQLINIIKTIPRSKQLAGFDINAEAIEAGNKAIKGVLFRQCSGEDIFHGDKGTDVTLTCMMLIYVGPFKIKKYLKEIIRITIKYAVLY